MIFYRWWDSVEKILVSDNKGWGLCNRYECKDDNSHEKIISEGLRKDGFKYSLKYNYSTIGLSNRCRPDGVVIHPDISETFLWYELKSVFIPHYSEKEYPHNNDFARLLRIEHPNGALGDVNRLRKVQNAERVFLLLALSWSTEDQATILKEYERHRAILLKAFQRLAQLERPTKTICVNGENKPWSCRITAWLL
jgi:hypothetical protein